MREFRTDFEFKDNRNYVHSTTMLEEICRIIFENYFPEESWDMPRIDAKFHREVLCNGSFWVAESAADLPKGVSVSADFRFYDKEKCLCAAFMEDRKKTVKKRINTRYIVEDIVLEKDFSGTCKIECNNRVEYTENIIEANKRMHLLTLKDKTPKIINLYMKKFPVFVHMEEKKPLLKVENLSIRHHEEALATLNVIYFPHMASSRFEMAYIVEGI